MTNYWNAIKNKFLKEDGIFSIGFSDIIGSGIAAVFWLYVASVMNPSDYGEIHYFLAIAGMAQIVSMLGNSHALTVYSAKKENIQSTLFVLSIIPTIISCIIIIIIFNRLDAGLLAIGYVVFESVNSVVLGRKFYRKYAKIILIQKSLIMFLGISFFYAFGPSGIIFALALTFIPHLTIFIKEFQTTKINFTLLKPKKNFIINNYFMRLSGGIAGQIDKIILAPLLGFSLLGNYSLAFQIFAILIVFSTIVFKYLLPQDASGVSNRNLKIITIIVSVGISIFGIFVLPKLIPLFFPKFIEAVDAITIISVAVIPETITILYASKMLGKEKSKFVLISKLISLAIIVIGFILLGPILGIMGLAAVVVCASIIQACFLAITDKIQDGVQNVKQY
jgi:O-antigen/teichoic acid export membrane protein